MILNRRTWFYGFRQAELEKFFLRPRGAGRLDRVDTPISACLWYKGYPEVVSRELLNGVDVGESRPCVSRAAASVSDLPLDIASSTTASAAASATGTVKGLIAINAVVVIGLVALLWWRKRETSS